MGIPVEGSTLSLVAIDLFLRIHRIQSQSSGRNRFPLLSILFESATDKKRQKFIRLILHFVLQETSAFWNVCFAEYIYGALYAGMFAGGTNMQERLGCDILAGYISSLKHLHETSVFWQIHICSTHLRWHICRNIRLQSSWHICGIHVYSDKFAGKICILIQYICILAHLQGISAVTNMHERLLAILLHGLTARFCIALTNHAPVSAYVHIVDKCLSINLITRHLVALTHHAHEHKVINLLSDNLMARHCRRSTVQFRSPMPFAWHMSWS